VKVNEHILKSNLSLSHTYTHSHTHHCKISKILPCH